jgi:hypothetical protein
MLIVEAPADRVELDHLVAHDDEMDGALTVEERGKSCLCVAEYVETRSGV